MTNFSVKFCTKEEGSILLLTADTYLKKLVPQFSFLDENLVATFF